MPLDRDVAVRIEGMRDFRRALKLISPEVDKELKAEIRKTAGLIAADAQHDPRTPRRTGRYAASIRPYVTATKVSVGSRLPQAGVLHWGGTIRPRGRPITFRARPVVFDAAQRQMDQTAVRMGGAIERAADRAGWNT